MTPVEDPYQTHEFGPFALVEAAGVVNYDDDGPKHQQVMIVRIHSSDFQKARIALCLDIKDGHVDRDLLQPAVGKFLPADAVNPHIRRYVDAAGGPYTKDHSSIVLWRFLQTMKQAMPVLQWYTR